MFAYILEKATNEELKEMWYKVMNMEFMLQSEKWDTRISIAFELEVRKRLSNGTMKSEISYFPTDWELFVDCCKD